MKWKMETKQNKKEYRKEKKNPKIKQSNRPKLKTSKQSMRPLKKERKGSGWRDPFHKKREEDRITCHVEKNKERRQEGRRKRQEKTAIIDE